VLWQTVVTINAHQLWLRRNDRVYQRQVDPATAVANKTDTLVRTHLRSLSDSWLYRRSSQAWGLLLHRIIPLLFTTKAPTPTPFHQIKIHVAYQAHTPTATARAGWLLVDQSGGAATHAGWRTYDLQVTRIDAPYTALNDSINYVSSFTASEPIDIYICSTNYLFTQLLRGRWKTKHRRTRTTRLHILTRLQAYHHRVLQTTTTPTTLAATIARASECHTCLGGLWRAPEASTEIPPTDRPPLTTEATSHLITTTLAHIRQRLIRTV
jgi:hypothetical protein